MFPGAQRMNRGNHEIAALVRACKGNSVTDLVIVHETRGQPGIIGHWNFLCLQSIQIITIHYIFSNSPSPCPLL